MRYGIFERLFGRERRLAEDRIDGFYRMLDGYAPQFRTFGGKIYESELVRAAIDARARHASKLTVVITGSAKPALSGLLKRAPNEFMSWGQLLYRTSTILERQE